MNGAVSTERDKSSDVGNEDDTVGVEDGTVTDLEKGELVDDENKSVAPKKIENNRVEKDF